MSLSNHTVDYCRFQMNSQWSTAENVMMQGTTSHWSQCAVNYWGCQMDVERYTLNGFMTKVTTASESSHKVDHSRLQMNAHWSTAQDLMILRTTFTSVIEYSKLLGCKMDVQVSTLHSGLLLRL